MGISKIWSESKEKVYTSLSMLIDVRPEEASQVIRSSRIGALISILNSIVMIISTWSNDNWIFQISWLTGAILVFLYIANRSRIASRYKPKKISTRAVRKLIAFTIVFAFPWTIITYTTLGTGNLRDSLLVSMMCAGMAAGGSMLLYRVPLAAFGYIATILTGVCITIAVKHFDNLWPMIIYCICFGFVLATSILLSWHITREREMNFIKASDANKDLQKAYDEIRQMSRLDTLTGLLNRKAFIDHLSQRITLNNEKSFAIFLLDLDRFKNINDSIGHGAGDALLAIIAKRLQNAVSGTDVIARFGGDEFAMIIELDNAAGTAANVAARILNNLNQPVSLEHAEIHPNASIGMTLFPDHANTPRELISLADIALHYAKEGGRGRYKLYNRGMAESLARADKIERLLRLALSENKIEVYYQPKIDIRTGNIFGAEALMRCFDEEGNLLPTEEILDIAEERGLILQLSYIIFNRVKRDILNWRTLQIPSFPVAINVHDFDLKTSGWLLKQLNEMFDDGIDKNDIILEVTEGCFVGRGSDAATSTLDMLDEIGIKLSLDDFGTGHAALSHLKRLPVSELKIDREFIQGINQDHRDKAITMAAIELARRLGFACVAEGVETKEQADILADLNEEGIQIIGQGHYWSPPIKNEDFIHFVKTWQQKTNLKKSG